MIITVDIGNTDVTVGGFREGAEPDFVRHLPSTRGLREERWQEDLEEILAPFLGEIEGCAMSSVVPELTGPIRRSLERLTERRVLTVDPEFEDGLVLVGYDRRRLGNDRVVDAISALSQYGPPLAIFDLGTATTLSVLDGEGRFIGGMILPGVRLSMDALSAKAAQLPKLELEPPESLLGTDTEACMRSGAFYGAAAQVDGLIDRVEELLGTKVTAVLTGGYGGLILPFCRRAAIYDRYLQLKGLRRLYDREYK